jgi:hypothetical protein
MERKEPKTKFDLRVISSLHRSQVSENLTMKFAYTKRPILDSNTGNTRLKLFNLFQNMLGVAVATIN